MKNLKFEYLYRDAGNYKQYGEIVLRNPFNLTPEEVTKLLLENLIEERFFYPKKIEIPSLEAFPHNSELDVDWYEFERFVFTNETVTDNRSIDEFIACFI